MCLYVLSILSLIMIILLQDQTVVNKTIVNQACEETAPYLGEECTELLLEIQTCYSDSGSPLPPLSIPASVDQQEGERSSVTLMSGLSFLNPTPECLERVRPFLCLHIFGLCDANGVHHTTLRGECVSLRDDVCSREWESAVRLLPPGTLPVCEDLPDVTDECTGIKK